MVKHGERGLGVTIVDAVRVGDISEPITVEKVKKYCNAKSIEASENHLKVILSNATENEHSPNYKKYFKRIGRGQYVVLDEFRSKYYWLNVNASDYDWTFSDIKVGKSQIYSNLNPDGSKRQVVSSFRHIAEGDLAVAYETGAVKAITTLCKAVDKWEEDGNIHIEFEKIRDFDNGATLQFLKSLKELEDCQVVKVHRGTLFELKKAHFDVILQQLNQLNKEVHSEEDLYESVKKSIADNRNKRLTRLQNRTSTYPEQIEIKTKVFKRNPDVIAEVLIRANGICEECKAPAPFKRASDGTPYLEVHHKVRLADGGEDTVDNTIAVCPNCHRKLHFG